ncbi:hypothetical protein TorRG33x02_338400, partial [Trema orientale]
MVLREGLFYAYRSYLQVSIIECDALRVI